MAGKGLLVFWLLFVVQELQLALADVCTVYDSGGWGNSRFIYCSYGCCGSTFDQYCCTNSVGMIVGIVFGVVCFISITAVVICCCIKQAGHRGRVIHPVTNQGVFVVSSGTTTSNYSSYPTPYNNGANLMPGYGNSTQYPHAGYHGNGVLPANINTGPVPPPYSQVGGAYSKGPVYQPPPYSQGPSHQPPPYIQDPAFPPVAENSSAVYPPKPPHPS